MGCGASHAQPRPKRRKKSEEHIEYPSEQRFSCASSPALLSVTPGGGGWEWDRQWSNRTMPVETSTSWVIELPYEEEVEVAIVIANVQCSEELWEAHPGDMVEATEIYYATLRRLARARGGYEVRTMREMMVFAFDSAVNAVVFGVEAQVRLVQSEWPDSLSEHRRCQRKTGSDGLELWNGLRVRIGMDWGAARAGTDPSSGRRDFSGPAVKNAALAEAAFMHGGLTALTRTIVDRVDFKEVSNVLQTALFHSDVPSSEEGHESVMQILLPRMLAERWTEVQRKVERRRLRRERVLERINERRAKGPSSPPLPADCIGHQAIFGRTVPIRARHSHGLATLCPPGRSLQGRVGGHGLLLFANVDLACMGPAGYNGLIPVDVDPHASVIDVLAELRRNGATAGDVELEWHGARLSGEELLADEGIGPESVVMVVKSAWLVVVQKTVLALERYNLVDAEREVAEAKCLPPEIRDPLVRLIENHERYKPYLPYSSTGLWEDSDSCSDLSSEEGASSVLAADIAYVQQATGLSPQHCESLLRLQPDRDLAVLCANDPDRPKGGPALLPIARLLYCLAMFLIDRRSVERDLQRIPYELCIPIKGLLKKLKYYKGYLPQSVIDGASRRSHHDDRRLSEVEGGGEWGVDYDSSSAVSYSSPSSSSLPPSQMDASFSFARSFNSSLSSLSWSCS